jgi:hypothetical protein
MDRVNKGLCVETIARDGNYKNVNGLFNSTLTLSYTNLLTCDQDRVLLKIHILATP